MTDEDRRWRPADTVPRRMLDMCKDTLRLALAEREELRGRLLTAHAEVDRLRRMLSRERGRRK